MFRRRLGIAFGIAGSVLVLLGVWMYRAVPRRASRPSPPGAVHRAEAEAPLPEPPPGLANPTKLEDPSGRALVAFHEALRRAERGEGQARLLFYGGSHTAADHYVGWIRESLQKRFGDLGRGFAVAAWPMDDHHYWQWGVNIEKGEGWKRLRVGWNRKDADYYGLSGVVFDSDGEEAEARIETTQWGVGQRASKLEVWYQTQPDGGFLEVYVDGELWDRITTHDQEVRPGFAEYPLTDGGHRIVLKALPGASVRVYGVVLEREGAGVVVDNAGLVASRARFQLKWLDPVYSEHLRRRKPDLVGLFYGGNEGDDYAIPINVFARRSEKVLLRIKRTVPDASCLVIGPADKPMWKHETWVHRARTTSIARVQRKLAAKHGCAYFDTIGFMGGGLSMLKWVSSDPPLGRDDYVHFTATGYRLLGKVLLDALLEGYEETKEK